MYSATCMPGPAPPSARRCAKLGRAFVELGVGAAIGTADRGAALRDGVGNPLEQIGKIELQRGPSARYYSPILT